MPKNKKIETLRWIEKNMFDEFANLKEAIFSTYYSDDEVISKIEWNTNFIDNKDNFSLDWNPDILKKIKEMKPFWKKF